MIVPGWIENAMHFQAVRMLIDGARPTAGDCPARGEQTAVRPYSSEAALAEQVDQ
jgi:hypothetical protein